MVEPMKACPFCGGTDIFVEPDEVGSGGQWVGPLHVGCSVRGAGCGAQMVVDGTEAEAITAWNQRAHPTAEDIVERAPNVLRTLADIEQMFWRDHSDIWALNVRAAADLIQSLQSDVERLREALADCAEPMRVLRRQAEADGCHLNSTAVAIANDASFIKGIARACLASIGGVG